MITNLLSLNDIFKNRFFQIPDYQRGYSWEVRQLNDLIKDIENLFEKDHKHYTGTIVATPTNVQGNEFDIVDGQQRLTTLIILIKAIVDSYPGKHDHLKDKFILRGDIGNEIPVIQANNETKDFFKEVIIENKTRSTEMKSHERLLEAKRFFKKWVLTKSKDLDRVIDVITLQLGFLFFSPANTKEIGIMFEVINNRGKELSELEKIKNYFIYYATIYGKETLRDTINSNWGMILFYLSKADVNTNDAENRFLRNCYIVFFDASKSKSWYVYDELKDRYKPDLKNLKKINKNIEQIQNFINFLVESSLSYAYLYNLDGFFKTHYQGEERAKLEKILRKLRCQPVKASILPLYISIMSRLDQPQKIISLLEIIEILNFRVYILPKITSRADSRQADLFFFANEFFNDKCWHSDKGKEPEITIYGEHTIIGDIFDKLRFELIEFTKYHCGELKFIQSLTIDEDEPEDYYHWIGIRFFLANYEEYLQKQGKNKWDIENILIGKSEAGKETNDLLSLEHIWATKNRKDYFGEKHRQKRRLGNFVLMGLSKNIKLKAEDIGDKIHIMTAYNKNKNFGPLKLSQVTALEEFYYQGVDYVEHVDQHKRRTDNYFMKISAKINDLRELDMINYSLKRWKLPGEKLDKFDAIDTFKSWQEGRNENYYLKNI